MKGTDRYLWLSAGVGLLMLLLAAAFAPSAIAQSRQSKTEEYLETFEEIFRYIENNFVEEIAPRELFEGALGGMFDVLDDPYSYYLDEVGFANLSDTTTGNFGGVGLIISRVDTDSDDETARPAYIEVVTPIEGTPAYRAGISAGDLITSVEGTTTEHLSIDEVVETLRGEPGTSVVVTIHRGRRIPFDVEIVRAVIEVPTVKSAMIDDEVGYLRITNFTPFTDDRIEDAIFDLELSRYRALVIDVRNNPGGLLRSVVDTADLFLADVPIVTTRSRISRENKSYDANDDLLVPDDIPIILLINEGSASASEILAGALRDNERATLVGEATYGKASVQQVRDLGEVGFKITTARYYTPSGRNIDEVGIVPDLVVSEPAMSDDDREELSILVAEGLVEEFVAATGNPSEAEIDSFVQELSARGITLEERIVRRQVRSEANRTNNDPPIFDLDYDLALQEALVLLRKALSSQ